LRKPRPVTIDFETQGIEPRPDYPPQPVGVSIKYPGKPARYYAFGHPTENNCTKAEAERALRAAWIWPHGILCHNAKFDYDVATTHMGMPELAWDMIHDTMFMVFLQDPHAESHGLKQSAERLLQMPPDERDAVRDWLVLNSIVTKSSKSWGAFIARAPGNLVGSYADGDTSRTELLFAKLWPELRGRKMLVAYDRERQLMPCLLDMERRGVPVDLQALTADCTVYASDLVRLTAWCCKRLGIKNMNLDSGIQLVNQLILCGKVDLTKLGKTPSGEWKTDKAGLAESITDPTLAAALNHRASLQTCLNTFMQPWLTTARRSGGRIFTSWNQLKQYSGNSSVGAVTGRMSSTPNFQNIPKEFPPMWAHQQKGLPRCPIKMMPLPLVRSYITASPGHALLCRDYSQQELRILAEYESGELADAYEADPWMDVHQTVMDEINTRLEKSFNRGLIKTINFGLIYGMGHKLMALKAKCSEEDSKAAKAAVLSIYPGLRELQRGLFQLAQDKLPLRTWGGREYHVEPPKAYGDEKRTYEYKMLNVLIQGSAADCTKQAIITYYLTKPRGHQLLLTVHDELLVDAPLSQIKEGMDYLQRAMESVDFTIPMLSEGKISVNNWANLQPYDKKGKVV